MSRQWPTLQLWTLLTKRTNDATLLRQFDTRRCGYEPLNLKTDKPEARSSMISIPMIHRWSSGLNDSPAMNLNSDMNQQCEPTLRPQEWMMIIRQQQVEHWIWRRCNPHRRMSTMPAEEQTPQGAEPNEQTDWWARAQGPRRWGSPNAVLTGIWQQLQRNTMKYVRSGARPHTQWNDQ